MLTAPCEEGKDAVTEGKLRLSNSAGRPLRSLTWRWTRVALAVVWVRLPCAWPRLSTFEASPGGTRLPVPGALLPGHWLSRVLCAPRQPSAFVRWLQLCEQISLSSHCNVLPGGAVAFLGTRPHGPRVLAALPQPRAPLTCADA